jgi:hypothetical protein
MTNKEFTEATDNFIYMIVNDSTFNERKQREQLNNITGLTGVKLDALYKDISRTIFDQPI